MCSVRLAKEKFTITKDIHIKGIITKHTHTHCIENIFHFYREIYM